MRLLFVFLHQDFNEFNSNFNSLLKIEVEDEQHEPKPEYVQQTDRPQPMSNSISTGSLKRTATAAVDDHSDDDEHQQHPTTSMKTTDIFTQRQQKKHIKQN
jgi:hypothetical protein